MTSTGSITAPPAGGAGQLPDEATCYRALSGRDPRFDGWIYVGVTSTGIYCRPSCPARTPKPGNCRWFAAAGAAQQAGFRACRRCHPDAVPGSPAWNLRNDVAGRAMRLIADGTVDREGVAGLASRLGYSERQLQRVLIAETGAPPLVLARAQRAHAARLLIENSALPMTDIAFAAGFSSVRQFNETVREVFSLTPTQLRTARKGVAPGPGILRLRLPVRQPFAGRALLEFFGRRTVAGLEASRFTDETVSFARSVRLPAGAATFTLHYDGESLQAQARLQELSDLGPLVARLRRMCDLDADPEAVDRSLARHRGLAAMVRARPGLRIPGTPAADELVIRALLGQQISLQGGTTATSRLVAEYGEPLPDNLVDGSVTMLFPSAERLAAADPEALAMPRARGRALVGLASALATGALDLSPGSDSRQVCRQLLSLRGIGPWTTGYTALRGLGDPDVLLSSDLIIARQLQRHDLTDDTSYLAPWRSYATVHLWNGAC